jgi:hypothetical protein
MAAENRSSAWIWIVVAALFFVASCSKDETRNRDEPDEPMVRAPYTPAPDDPSTSNDESNDQPLGHFGTRTLVVSSDEMSLQPMITAGLALCGK